MKIGNGWNDSWFWVAHPDALSSFEYGRSKGHMSLESYEAHRYLIDRRSDIDVLGGVIDEDVSYDYDEFALIKLDEEFYLLETSGCSCPSPTETWEIIQGPTSLSQIKECLVKGKYYGYTLPGKKLQDFLNLIDSYNN